MAHPDFEDATYAHLRDINKELLIPNLDLIPPNTISLLETNPKFIESYMVGLNHEMARELLWREYPTDLRGSYFRQFWEVKGVSNPDTPADAEQLKDIDQDCTPGQRRACSARTSRRPARDADVQPGEKQLVLVIRGELLKRYPNTVIYAQKAIDDGTGQSTSSVDDGHDAGPVRQGIEVPALPRRDRSRPALLRLRPDHRQGARHQSTATTSRTTSSAGSSSSRKCRASRASAWTSPTSRRGTRTTTRRTIRATPGTTWPGTLSAQQSRHSSRACRRRSSRARIPAELNAHRVGRELGARWPTSCSRRR